MNSGESGTHNMRRRIRQRKGTVTIHRHCGFYKEKQVAMMLGKENSPNHSRQGPLHCPYSSATSTVTLQCLCFKIVFSIAVSVCMVAHVLSVEHAWVCEWLHMYILWSICECTYGCTYTFCGAYISVLMTAHAHSVEHTWVCAWLSQYRTKHDLYWWLHM